MGSYTRKGLEKKINFETDVRQILLIKDRWLTPDNMKAVYGAVFKEDIPTKRDMQIQRDEPMSAVAVKEDLGEEMQATYNYLVEAQKFLSAGKRPHNFDDGLLRHLWETAHITNVIGCPIETKQLALVHSLVEHKARGLPEARTCIGRVREGVGGKLADNLDAFTDRYAILLDVVEYKIKKTGNLNNVGKKTNHSSWEKILEKQGGYDKEAKLMVNSALEAAVKRSGSKDRLIPAELTKGPDTYKEARAILHRSYVERLYRTSRKVLEDTYGKKEVYSNPLLVVKAVCLIDRLRTANERLEIEKATRETLDFLPFLDTMRGLLENSEIVDNQLAFFNASLKAELLTELDQRTIEAKSRRDQTTVAGFANLLESRLLAARREYGDTAIAMGYAPLHMKRG